MIPFDFDYYAPETLEEAVGLYARLKREEKKPLYYAGGTEIVTFCRNRTIRPGALIDLKRIPEISLFSADGELIHYGANLSLNRLSELKEYTLLAAVARRVADHTVRNRLTLGGNICGRLPYRETVLPFLLADAEALLVGPGGQRVEPLGTLFDKRLRLKDGEILVRLSLSREKIAGETWSRRREKHGPVDYPMLHTAALKRDKLALSVSGLCAYPFRSAEMEEVLNDRSLSPRERAKTAQNFLPGAVRNDHLGSSEYRLALWVGDLAEMLVELEGERK